MNFYMEIYAFLICSKLLQKIRCNDKIEKNVRSKKIGDY